jgi:hypothetical protein
MELKITHLDENYDHRLVPIQALLFDSNSHTTALPTFMCVVKNTMSFVPWSPESSKEMKSPKIPATEMTIMNTFGCAFKYQDEYAMCFENGHGELVVFVGSELLRNIENKKHLLSACFDPVTNTIVTIYPDCVLTFDVNTWNIVSNLKVEFRYNSYALFKALYVDGKVYLVGEREINQLDIENNQWIYCDSYESNGNYYADSDGSLIIIVSSSNKKNQSNVVVFETQYLDSTVFTIPVCFQFQFSRILDFAFGIHEGNVYVHAMVSPVKFSIPDATLRSVSRNRLIMNYMSNDIYRNCTLIVICSDGTEEFKCHSYVVAKSLRIKEELAKLDKQNKTEEPLQINLKLFMPLRSFKILFDYLYNRGEGQLSQIPANEFLNCLGELKLDQQFERTLFQSMVIEGVVDLWKQSMRGENNSSSWNDVLTACVHRRIAKIGNNIQTLSQKLSLSTTEMIKLIEMSHSPPPLLRGTTYVKTSSIHTSHCTITDSYYGDIRLLCRSQVFTVQRAVLISCSKFFKQLFDEVDEESKTTVSIPIIPIPVLIEPIVLEQAISHMYTNCISMYLIQDKLIDLLYCADYLQYDTLVDDVIYKVEHGIYKKEQVVHSIIQKYPSLSANRGSSILLNWALPRCLFDSGAVKLLGFPCEQKKRVIRSYDNPVKDDEVSANLKTLFVPLESYGFDPELTFRVQVQCIDNIKKSGIPTILNHLFDFYSSYDKISDKKKSSDIEKMDTVQYNPVLSSLFKEATMTSDEAIQVFKVIKSRYIDTGIVILPEFELYIQNLLRTCYYSVQNDEQKLLELLLVGTKRGYLMSKEEPTKKRSYEQDKKPTARNKFSS